MFLSVKPLTGRLERVAHLSWRESAAFLPPPRMRIYLPRVGLASQVACRISYLRAAKVNTFSAGGAKVGDAVTRYFRLLGLTHKFNLLSYLLGVRLMSTFEMTTPLTWRESASSSKDHVYILQPF